jgi:CHAT domain-containing protein
MALPFVPPQLVRLKQALNGLPASALEGVGLGVGGCCALLLLPWLLLAWDPSPRMGVWLDRHPTAGRPEIFSFRLRQGELLAVEVEQQGVDVELALQEPSEAILGPIDLPYGRRGRETIRTIASVPGLYRLKIRPLGGMASDGYYQVRVLRAEKPGSRARAWLEGQDLLLAGIARQSVPLLQRSAERFRMAGDLGLRAVAFWRAGRFTRNNLKLQRIFYQAAESHLPPEGRAQLLYGLGGVDRSLGLLDQALTEFKESAKWAAIYGNHRVEGWAWARIGGIHTLQARYERALGAYDRWLEIGPPEEKPGESFDILINIANTWQALQKKERARHFLSLALVLARRSRNSVGEAHALTDLAALESSIAKGEQFFLQAVRRVEDNPLELGSCYLTWGVRLTQEKRYAEARHLLERGRVLAVEAKALDLEINLAANIAHLNDLSGHGGEVISEFDRALRYYLREKREASAGPSILWGRAQALRRLNRLEEARHDIERAIQLAEISRLESHSHALRASSFASIRPLYSFYIDLLMQLGEVDRAFEVSEQARARTLLDELAPVGKPRPIPSHLLERRDDLKRQIEKAHLQAEMSWLSSPGFGPAAASRLDDLFAEYQQIEVEIERIDTRSASLIPAKPASLAEIQGALDEDTVLLSYILGEDQSYAWVVGRHYLRSVRLSPRARLEALTRAAYGWFKAKGRSGRSEVVGPDSLIALSHELLAPVAPEIRGRRLLVVADGTLHLLPFGGLPDPEMGAGAPVIASHEIVMVPSASVALRLQETARRRPWPPRSIAILFDPVYGFADPRLPRSSSRFDPQPVMLAEATPLYSVRAAGLDSLARLPSTEREGEEIAALFPDQRQVLKASGFRASRKTALGSDLAGYQAVHFAMHAYWSGDRPPFSGIVLSTVSERGEWQDGFVRAFEVYELSLPTSLVVLSGCETGLGEEIEGDGVTGLVRAFLYAGSPRVVASLWEVDDEATALLMSRFYRGVVRERLPAATALARAQREVREVPRWHDPHYWAGFVLTGSWP